MVDIKEAGFLGQKHTKPTGNALALMLPPTAINGSDDDRNRKAVQDNCGEERSILEYDLDIQTS